MEVNLWAPGKPSQSRQKHAERERIARQTEEFLRRGGKITIAKPGQAGERPHRSWASR